MKTKTDNSIEVIELCERGMVHDQKGNFESAKVLFQKAWELSATDFEKCISAHYVARYKEIPEEKLHWNMLALVCAHKAEKEKVKSFYASLYANVGHAHFLLGNKNTALESYKKAESYIDDLRQDEYGESVKEAIEDGLSLLQ